MLKREREEEMSADQSANSDEGTNVRQSASGERRSSGHHFNPKDAAHSDPPVHPQTTSHHSDVKKADVGLLYRDPEAALKDVDLQDADDITVKEFKLKMDDTFHANIVRPGDPRYQYDIRKTVAPTEKSEWDSD
jgi:hypothetical protein